MQPWWTVCTITQHENNATICMCPYCIHIFAKEIRTWMLSHFLQTTSKNTTGQYLQENIKGNKILHSCQRTTTNRIFPKQVSTLPPNSIFNDFPRSAIRRFPPYRSCKLWFPVKTIEKLQKQYRLLQVRWPHKHYLWATQKDTEANSIAGPENMLTWVILQDLWEYQSMLSLYWSITAGTYCANTASSTI